MLEVFTCTLTPEVTLLFLKGGVKKNNRRTQFYNEYRKVREQKFTAQQISWRRFFEVNISYNQLEVK